MEEEPFKKKKNGRGKLLSFVALSLVPSGRPQRFTMASSPSLLCLRPCPQLCGHSRSGSLHLHLSKQSLLHPVTSPRTCRRPVAGAVAGPLVPRPPGTRRWRWTGPTAIVACRCSSDAENGPPTPPQDTVLDAAQCCVVGTALKSVSPALLGVRWEL